MIQINLHNLPLAWTPNAPYLKDQWIITPAGHLAQAKVDFTAGAVYDANDWVEYIFGGAGTPGADGESAYQIWLDLGNTGTEQDFLDSLVGPQGAPGVDGVDGINGGELIDIGKNTTSVATAANGANNALGGAVQIPQTVVDVPDSGGRDIFLRAYSFMQQSVAGAGIAVLEIWEVTGAPVKLWSPAGKKLPNSVAASMKNEDLTLEYHLGPVVGATRSFELRINVFGSGSTPSVSLPNLPTAPSWLAAIAL